MLILPKVQKSEGNSLLKKVTKIVATVLTSMTLATATMAAPTHMETVDTTVQAQTSAPMLMTQNADMNRLAWHSSHYSHSSHMSHMSHMSHYSGRY